MIERIDSNSPSREVISYCRQAHDDPRPAAVNMYAHDWENNPASLLHKLYIQKKFDGPKAGYLIYKDQDTIVGSLGYYPSEIDPTMMVLGSRGYSKYGYFKHNMQSEMVSQAIDLVLDLGMKGGYFTWNKYNLKRCKQSVALNEPKQWKQYYFENGKHYREPGIRLRPLTMAGPYEIEYTQQWISYHLHDRDHEQTFLQILSKHKYTG